MRTNDLPEVLARIGQPRLLVLGDLLLDRYTWGRAERLSPEAPVLVLDAQGSEDRAGGAAAVAVLAAALGARVRLAGVLGNDAAGRALRSILEQVGVEVLAVMGEHGRPTTLKERFLIEVEGRRPQHLLRVDRECRRPLAPGSEAALVKAVLGTLAEHEAVLVADYGKGACGKRLLGALQATAILHDVPVLVDPARGADWRLYRGAALLAPNRSEAGMALRREIRNGREAVAAARRLLRRYSTEAVLVKLDRAGMALAEAGGEACLLPPWTSAAEDVAGAGDVVLAVLGLCRAAGVGWEPAARLAAVAAGLEVGKRGVAPVWPAEIRRALTPGDRLGAAKVVGVTDLAQLAAEYRRSGLSLVLTNGCFDLLHAGHLHCLSEASRLGDVLVVAINGDAGVRRLKGPGRPVVAARDRAALLAALECVHHVVVFEEDTPHALLQQVRPDVLAKGGTYTPEQVVGREVVEAYGGNVCVTGVCPGLSTTGLLASLRSRWAVAASDGDGSGAA